MKRFGILIAVVVMVTFWSASFYAKEKTDPLQVYRERLEDINKELGTSYHLLKEGECSKEEYQEIIDTYVKLTLKEFEDEIKAAHYRTVEIEKRMNAQPVEETEEDEVVYVIPDEKKEPYLMLLQNPTSGNEETAEKK